jgi:hypothetical protein
MGELATRVRAKFPGSYDDMNDQQLEAAVLAKHPEYQDLAGPSQNSTPTLTNQFRPSFAEGVSGGAGMPSTPDELTAAEQPRSPMDYLKMALPGLQVAGMVKDYGQNIYNRGKQAVSEAYDAGQNIGNGQPAAPNLGKAALGAYQTANAAIPLVGEQANKVGEDVSQGNTGAAFGRGLTTLALLGIGGEKGGLKHPEIQQAAMKSAARSGVEAVLQPQAKQFRFGKDPVGFVVDNGISANSLEDLHNNIKQVVEDKSKELNSVLSNTKATVDLRPAKKIIRQEIDIAMQKRDAPTISKLTELYNRLSTRVVPGQSGVKNVPAPGVIPAAEAAQVKRGIQESINWADQTDKPINNVKLKVQHAIADGIHTAVPESAPLDEHISSGIEAQKAAESQWLKEQAGKRTVKSGTRAAVVGGAIGGLVGGPAGIVAGGTVGRYGAKALGYPTVGTYLSKVMKKP